MSLQFGRCMSQRLGSNNHTSLTLIQFGITKLITRNSSQRSALHGEMIRSKLMGW